MIPKIKRLLSICGGYLKQLWGRMCSMPNLFAFLTLLQVLMGSLMILHLRMEMPLLLWLGGYIAGTAILMTLPAILPQRWWRITWTSLIVLLSAVLFIYEYYLLTEYGTLLTQTILLQYYMPANEVCRSLLPWSMPMHTLLEAIGLLCGISLVTWLTRKGWGLVFMLLLVLISGIPHATQLSPIVAGGISNDEAYTLAHEYNMMSRYIGTTLGVFANQKRYDEMAQNLWKNVPTNVRLMPQRKPHNVVVIIGESLRRLDMHCYGYPLENTPHLDSLVRSGSLTLYDDVVCPQPNTITSLRRVLTIRGEDEQAPWDATTTLPIAFSSAGYKTYWCSNQEMAGDWIEEVSLIASTADSSYYTEGSTSSSFHWKADRVKYDELLLPHLTDYRQITSPSGHLLVMTHLMGNHADFTDRYPHDRFGRFTAEDLQHLEPHLSSGEAQNSAEYMNSILYNDYIVSEIIKYYSHSSSIVIYLSDHGLARYDNPDAPHQAAHSVSERSLQIPFMVYMSDQFAEENPDILLAVQRAKYKPFMTDLFTSSLMGLMGIESNYTIPRLQLWSLSYDATRPRRIKGFGSEVTFSPKHPDQLCKKHSYTTSRESK
ncbi:phosphoethanolamine transferase [uncultured Porphyromonas sp.]|uniref:phosphoethanolamine transferase n=1 Tax=uncultured Porphyromonas sp. TaxID=159274 RepID=UPI002803AF88|nr:phosphoethanolamine transferase [uncultured Porphyromonas sp.]